MGGEGLKSSTNWRGRLKGGKGGGQGLKGGKRGGGKSGLKVWNQERTR